MQAKSLQDISSEHRAEVNERCQHVSSRIDASGDRVASLAASLDEQTRALERADRAAQEAQARMARLESDMLH